MQPWVDVPGLYGAGVGRSGADEAFAGVTLGVEAGAGSGALIATVGVSAAVGAVAARLLVGVGAWLCTPWRRQSPASPSAPMLATTIKGNLDRVEIDPIDLLDTMPVVCSLTSGSGALTSSAVRVGSASRSVGLASDGSRAPGAEAMMGDDASPGAETPSASASSWTSVEAPSNLSPADRAVARANHASNAGGSATPHRAARAVDVRGHSRLELEALPHPGAGQDLWQHHLERAALACLEVEALVNGPHPAGVQAAHDLVAAVEDLPCRERPRRWFRHGLPSCEG